MWPLFFPICITFYSRLSVIQIEEVVQIKNVVNTVDMSSLRAP